MGFSATFIAARIAHYEALIAEIEDSAQMALAAGKQSYKLNTGQTDQSVVYLTAKNIIAYTNWAEYQLEMWCNRGDDKGAVIVRPGF